MKIDFRQYPTYIHNDGRVELKLVVDGKPARKWMTMNEFMDFLDDQLNALRHHLTGKTRDD
jgi:hypothetical protein